MKTRIVESGFFLFFRQTHWIQSCTLNTELHTAEKHVVSEGVSDVRVEGGENISRWVIFMSCDIAVDFFPPFLWLHIPQYCYLNKLDCVNSILLLCGSCGFFVCGVHIWNIILTHFLFESLSWWENPLGRVQTVKALVCNCLLGMELMVFKWLGFPPPCSLTQGQLWAVSQIHPSWLHSALQTL